MVRGLVWDSPLCVAWFAGLESSDVIGARGRRCHQLSPPLRFPSPSNPPFPPRAQYGTYPVFFELAIETTFPVSDAATAGFLVMAQVWGRRQVPRDAGHCCTRGAPSPCCAGRHSEHLSRHSDK